MAPFSFLYPTQERGSLFAEWAAELASGHMNRIENELCPRLVFQQLPGLTLPFLCPLPLSPLPPALDLEDPGFRCETLNKSLSPSGLVAPQLG